MTDLNPKVDLMGRALELDPDRNIVVAKPKVVRHVLPIIQKVRGVLDIHNSKPIQANGEVFLRMPRNVIAARLPSRLGFCRVEKD
jgi:hypothetical protein